MTIHSWFGILLFLIYVGGLLVIFAYFAALLPNQLLEIGKIAAATRGAFATLFIPMSKGSIFISRPNQITYTSAYQLFFPENLSFLFLVGLVLLLALVAVVKVRQRPKGPLRPFQYVQTLAKNPSSN